MAGAQALRRNLAVFSVGTLGQFEEVLNLFAPHSPFTRFVGGLLMFIHSLSAFGHDCLDPCLSSEVRDAASLA